MVREVQKRCRLWSAFPQCRAMTGLRVKGVRNNPDPLTGKMSLCLYGRGEIFWQLKTGALGELGRTCSFKRNHTSLSIWEGVTCWCVQCCYWKVLRVLSTD